MEKKKRKKKDKEGKMKNGDEEEKVDRKKEDSRYKCVHGFTVQMCAISRAIQKARPPRAFPCV